MDIVLGSQPILINLGDRVCTTVLLLELILQRIELAIMSVLALQIVV